MQFGSRVLVRLLLAAAALGLGPGCGGGGGGTEEAPRGVTPPPASAPAASNRAPTISARNVGDARVGVVFTFLPTASDADGDTLRFSAQNLPPWASLDPNSGRITGTPTADDAGAHESITITVADASRQAVTSPFTITVLGGGASASGTVALQWQEPGSKLNGSPLDDLAGYRILYGRNADDLDQSVLVMNPGTTSYDFTSLDSGVWYFAVVAVNVNGLEGPPSTAATKSI